MIATDLVACPSCGAAVVAGERFCEACGHDLPLGEAPPSTQPTTPVEPVTGPRPCAACGGVVADDGYCGTCGARAVSERDHYVEQPSGWVAAVCDRGIRHRRNEDASAVASDDRPGSRAVLVVCDGVSSSQDSDVASLAAARAALEVLVASHARGAGTDSALDAALQVRLANATDAASDAVVATTREAQADNPPSCTFVAAVIEDERLVVGVVGDSRAYWLPDDGEGVALTVDDSWAADQIAVGVPRAEAETSAQAHAITRWLGVDAPDHTPRVTQQRLDRPGWVLLCSDGLWNYCSPAADLHALVLQTEQQHPTPVALAEALVAWANAQGGHDNITVALARIDRDAADAVPPA